MRRRRGVCSLLALAAAVLVVLVGVTPVAAGVFRETVTDSQPIVVTFEKACDSTELITFEGICTFTSTLLVTEKGSVLLLGHAELEGTGIGSSGTEYVARQISNNVTHQRGDGPSVATATFTFLLLGPGPGNKLLIHNTSSFVIDASGKIHELTSNVRADCPDSPGEEPVFD